MGICVGVSGCVGCECVCMVWVECVCVGVGVSGCVGCGCVCMVWVECVCVWV